MGGRRAGEGEKVMAKGRAPRRVEWWLRARRLAVRGFKVVDLADVDGGLKS